MDFCTLKRFVIYLLGIVAAFLAIDRSIAFGLARLTETSNLRFSKLYTGGLSAELLVLGNSRAVNAFYAPYMEDALDVDVFNLAYNGMSVEVAEALMMDYLTYNAKPKLIVFEVTNLHVNNDLLLELKLYQSFSDGLTQLIRQDEPALANMCLVSHMYRYNSEMFLRALFYMSRSDQTWINSGSIDEQYASEYRPYEADQSANMLKVEGPNWEALMRMISTCEASDIELCLVISPYLRNHVEQIHSYPQWVGTLVEALPDVVEFYDFSDALASSECFADPLHINRKGGELLFEMMRKSGVFDPLKD